MNLGLQDKKVLVTGSTRGIGRAIAEAFAAEGCDVLITSRDAAEAERVAKTINRAQGLACDFCDAEQAQRLAINVQQRWQGLDIVVCNVGSGAGVSDPLPKWSDFAAQMTTNFTAAFNGVAPFLDSLIERKGVVLFVSSIAGMEAFGAPTAYSVAKTALLSLSKNLARKLAPQGVRVNTLSPGNVLFAGGSWEQKLQREPERVNQLISATVPMQRFASPEEIASCAVFLCSPRASFVTGANLVADGGQTVGIF